MPLWGLFPSFSSQQFTSISDPCVSYLRNKHESRERKENEKRIAKGDEGDSVSAMHTFCQLLMTGNTQVRDCVCISTQMNLICKKKDNNYRNWIHTFHN